MTTLGELFQAEAGEDVAKFLDGLSVADLWDRVEMATENPNPMLGVSLGMAESKMSLADMNRTLTWATPADDVIRILLAHGGGAESIDQLVDLVPATGKRRRSASLADVFPGDTEQDAVKFFEKMTLADLWDAIHKFDSDLTPFADIDLNDEHLTDTYPDITPDLDWDSDLGDVIESIVAYCANDQTAYGLMALVHADPRAHKVARGGTELAPDAIKLSRHLGDILEAPGTLGDAAVKHIRAAADTLEKLHNLHKD